MQSVPSTPDMVELEEKVSNLSFRALARRLNKVQGASREKGSKMDTLFAPICGEVPGDL